MTYHYYLILTKIPYERTSYKEQRVNALAPEADEGRRKLRKAAVRCKQSMTRRCPNGETRLSKPQSSYSEYIAI